MRYSLLLCLLPLILAAETLPLKPTPISGLLPSFLWPAGTTVPATAQALTVGSEVYWFFDLDGDGQPWDAMGIKGENFMVPVPDRLLLTNGQWVLDKTNGTVTRDVLTNVAADVLRDCAILTRLRIREGLRPVWIHDEQSGWANLHAEYLRLNPMKVSLEMHNEDPTKRGYTPEGASVGGSKIEPTPRSMEAAIMNWYCTLGHSTVITGPMVVNVRVGYGRAAALLGNVNVDKTMPETVQHPRDNSGNAPRSFTRGGEIPEPFPGDSGTGRGQPIYFSLHRNKIPKDGPVPNHPKIQECTVVDNRGRAVAGRPNSPASKDNPEGHLGRLYFFLPDGPLAARTLYRVRFVLTTGHVEEWSFTTGD
jgi:hypothetical protein